MVHSEFRLIPAQRDNAMSQWLPGNSRRGIPRHDSPLRRASPLLAFVLIVLTVLVPLSAHAADIGVDEKNRCYLLNTIQSADPPKLKTALSSRCRVLDVISYGGDVAAALEMGRMIRRNQVSVVVPTGNGHGTCASACVFLYAAGVVRVAYGPIRIHRPYYGPSTESFDRTQQKYRALERAAKSYLREMNVSETLFDKMMAIRPEDSKTLTLQEMEELGMGVRDPVFAEHSDNVQAAGAGLSKSAWLAKKHATRAACGDIDGIFMEGDQDRIFGCWRTQFPEYMKGR